MIDQLIGVLSENKYATALSICAMLLSIISLIYNRKNVKMQQYVNTITNERIKWIGTLRNDFSNIISYIFLTVYVEKDAEEWEENYEDNFFLEHDDPENISMEDDIEYREVKERIRAYQSMGRNVKNDRNNSNFIKCIDSVVMKLNDQDENDKELIHILEDAKFLPFGLYEKKTIEVKIKKIKNVMRKTLKNEWERVKKEVQKGGLVNGKRKKIFD
ncbi:hypothetical protein [Fibrobacter sp.]|uniref:hypothetical protein n=1 Tax=Fibrobacter sp. TaxID=35828 RepID=UPI00386AE740